MRRDLWGRLGRLEAATEGRYSALALPDGTTVRYTPDEALEAVSAAIRQRDHPLLGAFLQTDTMEGLPGLCSALMGSRHG